MVHKFRGFQKFAKTQKLSSSKIKGFTVYSYRSWIGNQ